MARTNISRSQVPAPSWDTNTKRAKRRFRCAARSRMSKTCSDKAREVFGTPELLENILMHVSARDVLAARQATRSMRDTVNGSSKLKKAIGMMPDPRAFFSTPLWKSSLFAIWTACPAHDPPFRVLNGINILWQAMPIDVRWICLAYPSLTFIRRADNTLARVNFYYDAFTSERRFTLSERELLPIQPPVEQMRSWGTCAQCSKGSYGNPVQFRMIHPKAGSGLITLGDLEDEVRAFEIKHSSCPVVRKASTRLFFEAHVPLRDDDPCLIKHKEVLKGRMV